MASNFMSMILDEIECFRDDLDQFPGKIKGSRDIVFCA